MTEIEQTTVRPDQLSKLTGFSEEELRNLVALGYFPRAKKGVYLMTPAIEGCFLARKKAAEESNKLPVYDSIAHCSAQTGIPVDRIKAAKRSGSGAFRSNRVYLEFLLPDLFSDNNHGIDVDYEKARILRSEANEKERESKRRAGSLVERAWVEKQLAEHFTIPFRQALDALPSIDVQCNPGDPALAHAALERHSEEIKRQMRERLPE